MKHKILMSSDLPLAPSGVGTQALSLINGLVDTGKYEFKCLGAGIKHLDYRQMIPRPEVVIRPINGFGDRDMIRKILYQERPDAFMIFNDPRFFIWVWEMEDEIHQVCPIVYWHLWDEDPPPDFNKVLYEATDLINCINWPTYQFVKEWFPEKTNYIPHAISKKLFYPTSEIETIELRKQFFKKAGVTSEDTFVCLWVNRNARRKNVNDLMLSWKLFLDDLEVKTGKRDAMLILHTDPFDENGPNLPAVINMLKINKNVFLSTSGMEMNDMRKLYAISDFVINISLNEGFGLSTLEGMQCGKPIIAVKTGGLTRQVIDHRDGFEHGFALEPDHKSLVGGQLVPYIFEAFVTQRHVADAIMKMYEIGKDGRRYLGTRAAEYVDYEFNYEKIIKSWDDSLDLTIQNWKRGHKSWRQITL